MDDLHLHESHQKFDSHPKWAGSLVQMLLFAHRRGTAHRAGNTNMLYTDSVMCLCHNRRNYHRFPGYDLAVKIIISTK